MENGTKILKWSRAEGCPDCGFDVKKVYDFGEDDEEVTVCTFTGCRCAVTEFDGEAVFFRHYGRAAGMAASVVKVSE